MKNDSIEKRAALWALGDDTGSSSKAIARHMLGGDDSGRHASYPSDGNDLGRCIRLLDAFPEWRARMPEMAEKSPAWAGLVAAWDELEAMYRRNDTGLYQRMKDILDGPEAADPNHIRLGPGMSIRIGR